MALGPAIFDGDILALKVARLPESMAKRRKIGGSFSWRSRTQEPNYRDCLLLRVCREWPRRRATEHAKDFPPPHLPHSYHTQAT
jgi:hypothetical protein